MHACSLLVVSAVETIRQAPGTNLFASKPPTGLWQQCFPFLCIHATTSQISHDLTLSATNWAPNAALETTCSLDYFVTTLDGSASSIRQACRNVLSASEAGMAGSRPNCTQILPGTRYCLIRLAEISLVSELVEAVHLPSIPLFCTLPGIP